MSQHQDYKFNVVLFGVDECPSGLSRSARLKSDINTIISILSALDNDIVHQSVKDCYWLGKFYSGASRPRPILINFVKIADVTSVLSKRRDLSIPYSIKPDMACDERLKDLKGRWSLIQSGVSRKFIRIRGDSLYVRSKLHGCVSNSKCEHATSDTGASCPDQLDTPKSDTTIVQHDNLSDYHVHITSVLDDSTTSHVNDICQQHISPTGTNNSEASVTPTLSRSANPAALAQPNTSHDWLFLPYITYIQLK